MKKDKKRKLLRSDKVFLTVIALLAALLPVTMVFSQATLSKSNIEVEKARHKVKKQKNDNQSLSMQVDELASLSNIQGIAKEYGLSYNNDNIIVINNWFTTMFCMEDYYEKKEQHN